MKRKAFTLVELLVVIAIIGILVGMLMPAVQQVREAARRISCANKLHQIVLALHNYESANQRFPHGWLGDDGEFENGWAWMSYTLPFVDQKNLQDEIDFSTAIRDMPDNETRVSSFDTLFCPSSPTKKSPIVELPDDRDPDEPFRVGRSHYVGSVGGRVPLDLMDDGER